MFLLIKEDTSNHHFFLMGIFIFQPVGTSHSCPRRREGHWWMCIWSRTTLGKAPRLALGSVGMSVFADNKTASLAYFEKGLPKTQSFL